MLTGSSRNSRQSGDDNTLIYVIVAAVVCCCAFSVLGVWLWKKGKLDGLNLPFLPKSTDTPTESPPAQSQPVQDIMGTYSDTTPPTKPFITEGSVAPTADAAAAMRGLRTTLANQARQINLAKRDAAAARTTALKAQRQATRNKNLLSPPRTASAPNQIRPVQPAMSKSGKPGTAPATLTQPLRR